MQFYDGDEATGGYKAKGWVKMPPLVAEGGIEPPTYGL